MPRLREWENFNVDELENAPEETLTLAYSQPPYDPMNDPFQEFVPVPPVAGISALLRKANHCLDIAGRYPATWHDWSDEDIVLLRSITRKATLMNVRARREISTLA